MDVLEVVTLNDLSSKEFVLDKREDLSLLVFNTITCECEFKRKFDIENLIQIKSEIAVNVDARVKF